MSIYIYIYTLTYILSRKTSLTGRESVHGINTSRATPIAIVTPT